MTVGEYFYFKIAYFSGIFEIEGKMKKTIVIIFIFLVSVLSLSAEEMTIEQQKLYNSQALSVQQRVETSGTSAASAFSTSRYSAFALGSSESTSTIAWDAYQGANQISKADFFRIAGYPEYEKICLDVEAQNKKNKSMGIGLTIGGGVGYTAGMIMMLTDLDCSTQFWIGCVIGLLSCVPLGFGIDLILESDAEPNISTSFAIGVADIYNRELQTSIKLNF